MRSILFFAMLIPVFVSAQINRSAKEFAGEQVQEYVTTKLFKGDSYKPVSFGELRAVKEKKNSEAVWSIEHKFEITEQGFSDQKATPRAYKFLFYLDEKMKIIKAETYLVN